MDKDKKIKDLMEQLNYKEEQLLNINNKYFEIINSKSWRLVCILQTIKKYILNPKLILQKCKIIYPTKNAIYYDNDICYQKNDNYDNRKTDIKAISFYYNHYYVNQSNCSIKFKNHYIPQKIDESNNKLMNEIKKDINLAKTHGIYGFSICFDIDKDKKQYDILDQFINHPYIEYPFCICLDVNYLSNSEFDFDKNKIIIKKLVNSLQKYLSDKCYIKLNSKPVIILSYKTDKIINVDLVISSLREELKEVGIDQIYVIFKTNFTSSLKAINKSDAVLLDTYNFNEMDFCKLFDLKNNGKVYDYSLMVDSIINKYKELKYDKNMFFSTLVGYDDSFKNKDYNILHHFTLDSFYKWNREIINILRNKQGTNSRFLFLESWNNWLEGNFLEPDKNNGYAILNTLSKSIFDVPYHEELVINNSNSKFELINKKIAVQIHLFYEDLCQEIIRQLNNIPYNFDCFITTDTNTKKNRIEQNFQKYCKAKHVYIDVTKNCGRDVAPFILQMSQEYKNYDYLCHIHTKKSTSVDFGDDWRKYLYRNLFGSNQNVRHIFEIFENNPNVGLIYPCIYPVVCQHVLNLDVNRNPCLLQLKKLKLPVSYINNKWYFPAGTMFWARMDAINTIFQENYTYDDFENETGQLDATPAHAIERIFCNLAKFKGYKYLKTYNNSVSFVPELKKRIILFAHFDENGIVSYEDEEYLMALKNYASKVIFITNVKKENIPHKESKDVILESELGYDFGAWKTAIRFLGEKELLEYDEIIFANNSRVLSGISYDEFFSSFNETSIKTLCYHTKENSQDYDYISSDLMVFPNKVFCKPYVLNFFENVPDCDNLVDKKKECNYNLTKLLEQKKVEIKVFINETKYFYKYIVDGLIDIKYPYMMLLLNSPSLNKKSLYYMSENQKMHVNNLLNQLKQRK